MIGNLLALVYTGLCSHFGYRAMKFLLRNTLDRASLIGIGSTFGVFVGAWICYILNLWFRLSLGLGFMNIVIISLITVPFILIKQKKGNPVMPPLRWLLWSVVVPGAFLSWFIYFGIYYKETWTRGACYGDLPFHLNLIASFAHGCNSERKSLFDLVTPFFAKERLAYPFMTNYYSAMLWKCFNCSGHAMIAIPSILFGFSIFAVLQGIVKTFTMSDMACVIAPWLFLFTGGLGFMHWIKYPPLRKAFYTDFVHHWGNGVSGSWFQTIIHVLLPQRASLHSIPIAWGIILILMHVGHSKKPKIAQFAAVGLLVAILPQVQPHSIIACAEWGVVYALLFIFPFSMSKLKTMVMNYGTLAVIALSLGLLQIQPYVGRTKDGFWRIAKLYVAEHQPSMFSMWWKSLGVTFVLSMIHGPSILKWNQWLLYIPSLAVWLISNNIMYQPWQLDNTKVFNAAWIPLALAVASNWLSVLYRKGFYSKLATYVIIFFACFSGILATSMAIKEVYPLWQRHDYAQELSEFAREHSSPSSIWILDPWHAHPVTALAGRQSVKGYGGWTSSHGLGESSRARMITTVLENPNDTRESDKFGVEFICVKKKDKKGIKFNWSNSTSWRVVFDNKKYTVYQRTDVNK